jgi:hypothetical protein
MGLGASVAGSLNSINIQQTVSKGQYTYETFVDGVSQGQWKTYAGAQVAAGLLPTKAAIVGEADMAKSILGGKPTLFVDNSIFGAVTDQLAFNTGGGSNGYLKYTLGIGGVLASGFVSWFFPWIMGKLFKESWSLYMNGYLVAVIASDHVPAIYRSYRKFGFRPQLIRNTPNKGDRIVIKPVNTEIKDKFYRQSSGFFW